MTEPDHICCSQWAEAQQIGTDNEGYNSLLFFDSDTMFWQTGTRELSLTEGFVVRFCPFCGEARGEQ